MNEGLWPMAITAAGLLLMFQVGLTVMRWELRRRERVVRAYLRDGCFRQKAAESIGSSKVAARALEYFAGPKPPTVCRCAEVLGLDVADISRRGDCPTLPEITDQRQG